MANRFYPWWILLITLAYGVVAFGQETTGLPENMGEFWPDDVDRFYQEPVGSWYATTEAGTYVVSGNRIFLFENVHLHGELTESLNSLVNGALWKEGYLLSHEIFLGLIWPTLPRSVRILLRGSSQAWLLWTTYHSLLALGSPLVTLLQHYYQYWRSPRYQGSLPILVNDPELSFRFFLQAHFPESAEEPTQVIIDRIPNLSELPQLVRRYSQLNPWNRLMDEMSLSGIERLEISGNADGDIRIRFREDQPGGLLQSITAAVNREYQPVPWLLEKIRHRMDRKEINIHASLLSQHVLELVVTMLSCRRTTSGDSGADHNLDNVEPQCAGGHIESTSGGLIFDSPISIAPAQIAEQRIPSNGRLFSLTGCSYSEQPLCWENTLIMSDGHRLYPWPSLTLSSRFSTFQERNNWILMGHEPQRWFSGSFFQVRVPELFTRILLGSLNIAGQTVVNRLVTSLHHRWWENGFVAAEPPPFERSERLEQANFHSDDEGAFCSACQNGFCLYPRCPVCKDRFKPATMVNLGCNDNRNREIKHHVCTECYFNLLKFSNVTECGQCGRYHRNMIHPANYYTDPGNAMAVPSCPLCRQPFSYERGNIGDYLGNECDALMQRIRWLFSDSLGGDSPHH